MLPSTSLTVAQTLALLLASPLSASAAPVCHDLPTQLDSILSSPAFDGAQVALHVERVDNGETLYSHQGDTNLVPASNIKIVSTAAALHYLGPDYRFQTELYGQMDERGTVNGGLYIRGNGDPWLVPERVWYLANRLYFLGVRQIRGDIIVDDTYFDGDREAIGREQDRSSYAYMAPRGAVSVGFNTLVVHVYPGAKSGDPAQILVEPKSDYARIDSSVVTIGSGRSRLLMDVVPERDRSVVKVSGRIHAREPGRGYYRRIDNPPIFAGEVFRQMFKDVGITIKGGKVRTGVVPEGASKLAQLASPRLSELINRVNKHSNNFMAEQVALAAGAAAYGAPATWEKAEKAIDAFLVQEVGLTPDSYKIRNASGLHDVNRMSAKQLVEILRYMYHRPRLRPEYVASMSVAGASGTLAGRMRETDAWGLLRAKTGTLSIASALSGYVTAKQGETLAFSVLVNNYKVAISEIWTAQDEVGMALATMDSACVPAGPALSRGASGHEEIPADLAVH